MILHIADTTKVPQEEAIEIAEYLRDHFDEEDARSEFYETLIQLYVVRPQYRRKGLGTVLLA